MKQKLIRTLSLVLALLFVSTGLVSCGGIDTSPVMEYKDVEATHAAFLYLCSIEKTNFLYEAYGVTKDDVKASQLEDNTAIWSAKDETGTTAADTLKMNVMQNLQVLLYLAQVAVENGYQLTANEKAQVRQQFDEMIAQSFRSKKEFNTYMKQYGIDYDALVEYNCLQTLAYRGNDLLFGENGTMRISEDTAKHYFNKNFITIQCIFINTKNKTYPNGKVVLLPESEKAEKLALADSLYTRLQAGEDFATLCMEYSDKDKDEEHAKNGYTFEKGKFYQTVVENKAFEMAEGELQKIETSEGIFFVRRLALNQNYFENEKTNIRDLLIDVKKFSLVADAFNNFKMDETFINELDISTMLHMV